ncbi:glycoside hydrolase family 95 protein [Actinotalea sp. M2MS4P-6]|uniref:glycoside hydrolase family 95 protein n=1 Tax=Actinotalea sp. M2MS4P-6 TaxID=2983762 RepID=UPI0021E4978E|nr:glycoside hydrolase family 95 protein [Actinotalea sp. M2MS4P-6]MCV2394475.1 glycoside hydrolase family 95 protein [Actinotalea sp. M2MS4P-6]
MSTLEYDGAAEEWLQALPLGNGRLGAMCWGGSPARFDLNHEGVWSGSPRSERRGSVVSAERAHDLLGRARRAVLDHRPADAVAPLQAMQSRWSQAFLPLATLWVEDDGPDVGSRSLDLATGLHTWVASTSRHTTAVLDTAVLDTAVLDTAVLDTAAFDTAVLATGEHDHGVLDGGVLVHRVWGPARAPRLHLVSPLVELARHDEADGTTLVLRAPSDVAPGHEPEAPATELGEDAVVAAVVVRRRPLPDGYVVVLAAETTFAGPGRPLGSADDARRRAARRAAAALRADPDDLLREHASRHADALGRSGIEIGPPVEGTVPARLDRARSDGRGVPTADPGLVALLVQHARYLLWSSSRDCLLPATLQGLWNDDLRPPWSSAYTLNINLEMAYWPAEVLGLPTTLAPLVELVRALAEHGRDTARRLYDAPGWVAHHNSDAWAMTTPVGAGHGDPSWAFWPFGGVWLLRALVEHVRFGSADEDFVPTVLWPLLSGAAEFVLAWLVPLPDGTLGTVPSTSPENTYRAPDGSEQSLTVSSALDLALTRDVLGWVVELGADDPITERARAALTRLPAPGPTSDGRIREWLEDVTEADPHHRHVSHLYPLYPGDTEVDEDAATRTLEARGDDSTGWSLAWKIALWARLHRPDRVDALLDLVFRDATALAGQHAGGLYPNLFAAHPPFQVDGNLGVAAALAECLVQSHRGEIELLPALPTALRERGRAWGLVARPGIEVDLEWVDGRPASVSLRPRPGVTGPVRVRFGGTTVVVRPDAELRGPGLTVTGR